MSLINQMLRDLSSRGPDSGEVFAAVRVMRRPPRRRADWRLVAALAGAAALASLWPLLRESSNRGTAGVSMAASEPLPARVVQRFVRFQLDTQLAPFVARVAAPPPSVAPAPERAPELRLEASLQRAAPAAAEPAAEAAPTPARNERAAEAQLAEAVRALSAGEPSTAEAALREALALDPRLHGAREQLTGLLVGQQRLVEAQDTIEQGLALEPARLAFRRLAARIDLIRGAPAAAVQRLEPAAPAVHADPEYHGLLAAAYQRVDRHAEASFLYQRLTQLHPGEAHWWAGYGLSRDALGDAAGALAAYGRARQLGALEPAVRAHLEQRYAALQGGG